MIDLRGKPIAITGASAGIGAAVARACARAGMPVALAARREDRLRSLAEEIERAGGRAFVRRVDVAQAEECRGFVEEAAAALGPLHAVLANAGYGFEAPVLETTDAALREILEVNVFGTLHTIRPALGPMLRAGSGHVLITTSCVSKIGIPFLSAYSLSKACQDHLGRALRAELAGTGVSVSTIHPIGTKTEFFEVAAGRSGGVAPGGVVSSSRTPGAFMQTPERVAGAVVRCLRRPRAEVWTSLPVRLGMAMGVAFPGVLDRALAWKFGGRR